MSPRALSAKARDSGAARQSTRHWWWQRLTAVALAPLSLWFLFALATLPSLDYQPVRDWIAAPVTTILLLIYLPCLFHHAQSGLQVIAEDYLHTEWRKTTLTALIMLIKCTAFLAGAGSVAAVLAIHIGV